MMKALETSAEHAHAMMTLVCSKKKAGIDRNLKQQEYQERMYCRQVLKRVVAVIRFLSDRGLPFEGTTKYLDLHLMAITSVFHN